MEIAEIEQRVGRGEMTAAQVFTQMRQHVNAGGMPTALTAENGAKAALMGEFSVPFPIVCPACHGSDDEFCDDCGNKGEICLNVNVPWTVIKEICAKAVEHFTMPPNAELRRAGTTQGARNE